MNSQYQVTNDIVNERPRNLNGSTGIGAVLQRVRPRLVLATIIMTTLALAPAVSRADQRIALVNATHTATARVTIGESQDVRTDQSFSDIVVGDPNIADVDPLTDHALSILGKKIGITRVTVYDVNKKPVGIFDVEVSYDVVRLGEAIARISGGGIRVSSVDGRIMLSGSVPDAVTLDKAVTLARQFAPDIINAVQVTQPQQVMLEVRFIEASRQAGRDLGVQWNMFGAKGLANVGDQVSANQLPVTGQGLNVAPNALTVSPLVSGGVLSGAAPFGFFVSQIFSGKTSLTASIDALEQKGLVRDLAQPNLVTLSGETASFLAGGEYPIPVPGALGAVTVDYKKYGVGLAFTPTVLNNGLINLVVKPNVSQLDPANSVSVANGISVPALTVREASTTMELRDGQSFMLGGLLQNTSQTNQDQLPWLGDVPVLGTLFRSAAYQKNETDLVIVVTPHIVRPLPPEASIHTPLDNTLPGNDVDFFLMGQAEVSPALARLAVGAINRPYVGHILDLPKNGGVYVTAKD